MAWGDTLITNNSTIRPLVWLSFKGGRTVGSAGTTGGTDSDDNYRYVVANESVVSFTIHVEIGTAGQPNHRAFTLSRSALPGRRRFFNDRENTYTLPAHHARDLNDLFQTYDSNPNSVKMKISLEVAYGMLSEYLLRYIARTGTDGGELHNIAYPASGDEINTLNNDLVRMTHTSDFGRRHRSNTRYKVAQGNDRLILNIPCMLSGRDVDNARSPAGVKLYIYMLVKERLPAADADRVTRLLVAADHYKLIRYSSLNRMYPWPFDPRFSATRPTTGTSFDVSGRQLIGGSWSMTPYTQFLQEGNNLISIKKALREWRKNVTAYFLNYVDLNRGRQIREKLIQATIAEVAANPGISRTDLVIKIRDEIDKYLITANHWHGSREVWRATRRLRRVETHQHLLSDTFGEIHGKAWGASPVHFIREITRYPLYWDGTDMKGSEIYWLSVKRKSWSAEDSVAFCLQVGTGHCGEHAQVCFSVLKEAMSTEVSVRSLLHNVISSGNANIDHAFCVVGLVANDVYFDRRTRSWRPGTASERRSGERLVLWDLEREIASGQTGGVVMDAYLGDLQRRTQDGLLRKIRRKERTHYLSFRDQYPHVETVRRPAVVGGDLLADI